MPLWHHFKITWQKGGKNAVGTRALGKDAEVGMKEMGENSFVLRLPLCSVHLERCSGQGAEWRSGRTSFFLSPATGKINYLSLQFAPAVHVQVEQNHENEFGERCAHGKICASLYKEGNFTRPARLRVTARFPREKKKKKIGTRL